MIKKIGVERLYLTACENKALMEPLSAVQYDHVKIVRHEDKVEKIPIPTNSFFM